MVIKKEKIIDEINDLDDYEQEVLLHENPFAAFYIYKNDILMKIESNSFKLSLNVLIKEFINNNQDSTNQDVINELEFKKNDLRNLDSFSNYSLRSIRFAYASFFYDLLILYDKGLIRDSRIDFKDKNITNKYEFIFKNLGISLKPIKDHVEVLKSFDFSKLSPEEFKNVKTIYKEAGIDLDLNSKNKNKKDGEKGLKYFVPRKPKEKNESFYVIKIKPRIAMLNPGGKLGRIKQYQTNPHKSRVFSDYTSNVRFFFLTKNSYSYLENTIYKDSEKIKITMLKFHLSPKVYFDEYYDVKEIFDTKLFDYNLFELPYREVKDVEFIKPDKIKSYAK